MNWQYEEGRVFATDRQGTLLAEATYVQSPIAGVVNIDHTYVAESLRGQGVAGELMKATAEHLRALELHCFSTCSYGNIWLTRNRIHYGDIIAPLPVDEQVACKLDGRR